MPQDRSFSAGANWRDRCEFWSESPAPERQRKRRERSSEPLILCGHGISLRVEGGTLAVKNGFTHYPQKQETFRYFCGDLDRPARIIAVDGSGALTFDVLDWLAEQDIPLIRVSWTGEVTTVAGGTGYSADREKVDWQRKMRDDARERAIFSADLIRRKIDNSAETLKSAFPTSENRDRAIAALRNSVQRLGDQPPRDVDTLRGVEGPAAATYFAAWQDAPLSWRPARRKPVPSEWKSIGPRASLRAGKTSKNRNATHPINAMLNYGYAVAVGQMKVQALAQGYDPSIGIMHHDYREGPAFALDLVEPVRPLVDRAVLGFALSTELHPADFVITGEGECRLNPQLAKRVAQAAERVARSRLKVSDWTDRERNQRTFDFK